MEYAKIYQVEEGSARREPLGGQFKFEWPSGLINASFLCLTPLGGGFSFVVVALTVVLPRLARKAEVVYKLAPTAGARQGWGGGCNIRPYRR